MTAAGDAGPGVTATAEDIVCAWIRSDACGVGLKMMLDRKSVQPLTDAVAQALAAMTAKRDAAVARVTDLEAALKPVVARAAYLEPDWLDHECHWHPAVGSPLTVGHLRAAIRALQPGSPS